MAKSYTKQLTEWVRQTRHSARRNRNRVAFTAVKNDVREALEEGWPVKTIWAHMVEQKRIECGYDTFLVYVKRHMATATEPPGASRSSQPPGRSLATEAGRSG
ncbi:TraK family protein, partial [Massilia niabensis]